MVDAPHFASHVPQAVANLPVGVVDDVIEQHHPFDRRVAAAPEVVAILAVTVWLDINLNATNAMWTVTNDGWRNEIPSRPAAKQICRQLAEVERALGKVVKGRLSRAGLVNGELTS